MSSSPTVPTSTTASSSSSRSRTDRAAHRVAVIACGAIAQPIARVVERRGWSVDITALPPLLHNHPDRIAAEVEPVLVDLAARYEQVVIGYADCGTYGALDVLCERHGVRRLAGLHCYDVYGGADRVAAMFAERPGTYVLTDFLVRSFERTVVRELGLDRYPELRDDYFAHYTQLVWLAQEPDDELRALAVRASEAIGLPLTEVDVGDRGLETSLEQALTP